MSTYFDLSVCTLSLTSLETQSQRYDDHGAEIEKIEKRREALRKQRLDNVKSRLPVLRQGWKACEAAMNATQALIETGLRLSHMKSNSEATGGKSKEMDEMWMERKEERRDREQRCRLDYANGIWIIKEEVALIANSQDTCNRNPKATRGGARKHYSATQRRVGRGSGNVCRVHYGGMFFISLCFGVLLLPLLALLGGDMDFPLYKR